MANKTAEQITDVLYQKLGEQWFAFSIVNDEVFMAPVSEDQIIKTKSDRTAVTSFRASDTNHETA